MPPSINESARDMRVDKYIPAKLYGFASDDTGAQVFFHLGVFQSPFRQDPFPPPILGERIKVEVLPVNQQGKAPKAKIATRMDPAVRVEGVVDTFDHRTGYGFINGDDAVVYYLHVSEVTLGRLPMATQRVRFYSGFKSGRPRACHVEILP
jgi:cold shock CspA family protein